MPRGRRLGSSSLAGLLCWRNVAVHKGQHQAKDLHLVGKAAPAVAESIRALSQDPAVSEVSLEPTHRLFAGLGAGMLHGLC